MKKYVAGLMVVLGAGFSGCQEKDVNPEEVERMVDQKNLPNEEMIANDHPYPQERLILEESLESPKETPRHTVR